MKKYKSNGFIGNKKAQIYGERLEHIKKSKGKLKPQYVVEDAKNPKSILHDYFEWNNSKAGEKYRIHQARQLISCIVEVVVVEGKRTNMKSFFNIGKDDDQERVYITLKEAVTKPNYKKQVLNQLIHELEYITDLMRTFKKYDD